METGGVAQVKEAVRGVRIGAGLDACLRDARYGWRGIWKSPVFAAAVIATLGLGIGANTAIFSLIDTLLVRPPAVAHVDRLVWFHESNREKIPFDVDPSPGNFLDWRRESR